MTKRLIDTDELIEWLFEEAYPPTADDLDRLVVDMRDVRNIVNHLASRPWVRVEDVEDWEDDAPIHCRYLYSGRPKTAQTFMSAARSDAKHDPHVSDIWVAIRLVDSAPPFEPEQKT